MLLIKFASANRYSKQNISCWVPLVQVSPIGVGAVNHKNIEVNKNFLESEDGKFF